jgi:hypothetical protein
MSKVPTSFRGVLAVVVIVVVACTLVYPFNSAEAIVSGHSAAPIHYLQYPYNLLVIFFTIVCSALLATILLHYYRAQWGSRSVITE